MTLPEFGVLVSIIVGVLALVRGVVAILGDTARGVYLLRHRGMPTEADLAVAPNLRWHTPSCLSENSTTFQVRLQCTVSGSDAQGADAKVSSSDLNDAMEIISFNEVGTHRVGEFTLIMRGRNTTITQTARKVSLQLVYFDTQGRFGYVTDCWADVSFDGNQFRLGKTFLDLSGPKARHAIYRELPKMERDRYKALFGERQ